MRDAFIEASGDPDAPRELLSKVINALRTRSGKIFRKIAWSAPRPPKKQKRRK